MNIEEVKIDSQNSSLPRTTLALSQKLPLAMLPPLAPGASLLLLPVAARILTMPSLFQPVSSPVINFKMLKKLLSQFIPLKN